MTESKDIITRSKHESIFKALNELAPKLQKLLMQDSFTLEVSKTAEDGKQPIINAVLKSKTYSVSHQLFCKS
jgi:hypothetical protein